jgi:hypothetical protein
MNLQKLLFFCLALMLCNSLFSQSSSKKVDIEYGPEFKAGRMTVKDIIGHDESGYYVLQFLNKGLYGIGSKYVIQKFGNDLELKTSSEIEIKAYDRKATMEDIIYFQDKLVIFSSYRDSKTKMNTLYMSTINKKTLAVNDDAEVVASIDYSGKTKFNAGYYNLSLSREETKLLVKYELPFKRKDREKFGLTIIDKDLSIVWDKQVTLPYPETKFSLEQIKVDDDGNVYTIGRLSGQTLDEKDLRKPRAKRGGDFEYRIITFKDDGDIEDDYAVVLKGQFITDLQLVVNDDKDIICTGFYSERGVSTVKGSYFLKLNGDNGRVIAENQIEFSDEFKKDGLSQKQTKKYDKKKAKGKEFELREYKIDEIILKDDGSALMAAEQWYVREVTRTSTGANGAMTTTTTFHYHFNSIVVINFDQDGNEIWTEKIKKNQHTINDGGFYSSFVLTVKDDQMFFVFNDNPRNIINQGGGTTQGAFKEKEIALAVHSLEQDGFSEREMLFSRARKELIAAPLASEQITDDELIIFCQKKKKQQFVKVTFK